MEDNIVLKCRKPPKGWSCTLLAGHDGPCPSRPSKWLKLWWWINGVDRPKALK